MRLQVLQAAVELLAHGCLGLARSAFVATRGLGRSEGDVLLSATQFCTDTDLCHLFLASGNR